VFITALKEELKTFHKPAASEKDRRGEEL